MGEYGLIYDAPGCASALVESCMSLRGFPFQKTHAPACIVPFMCYPIYRTKTGARAMSIRVETIAADLHSGNFLNCLGKGRGIAFGIMGRLHDEPEVPEDDDSRYIPLSNAEVNKNDPNWFKHGHYKSGVTASERLILVKRLWKIFRDFAEDPKVKPLYEAVVNELSSALCVEMETALVKEEKALAEKQIQMKADSARREQERLDREENEEKERLKTLEKPVEIVENESTPEVESVKPVDEVVESELPEVDEASFEDFMAEVETGTCELCEEDVPKDQLSDFEGMNVCQTCKGDM